MPPPRPDGRTIAAGVVRGPFGLRGDVFVHPDPDIADPFPPGRTYRVVEGPPDAPGTLTVATSAVHRGLQVARFLGVDDRTSATALRGCVLARPARPADLDPEAFWAEDVVGRPVLDAAGLAVGTVAAVQDGTAHDYLVVRDVRGRTVLLPAVVELVTLAEDAVRVADVGGLLDFDADER